MLTVLFVYHFPLFVVCILFFNYGIQKRRNFLLPLTGFSLHRYPFHWWEGTTSDLQSDLSSWCRSRHCERRTVKQGEMHLETWIWMNFRSAFDVILINFIIIWKSDIIHVNVIIYSTTRLISVIIIIVNSAFAKSDYNNLIETHDNTTKQNSNTYKSFLYIL